MRLPLALLALVAGLAAAPAASHAKTVWLCKPGLKDNPCTPGMTATRLSPTGEVQGTERAKVAAKPPIDCFYVYPTVSDQPTPAANQTVDQPLRSIALYQAARYSTVCRVFAPVYRQITLRGLLQPATVTATMRSRAYNDVRHAWNEYLAKENHGRGVVLLSHSQGTFVLRQLIPKVIEPKAASRKLLVSALLLGGNVTVKKGSDTGGDFKRLRACRKSTQVGCVVAYSMFNDKVPEDAIFGRPSSDRATTEVLCTNPAALGGGTGAFTAYEPTAPFGGTIGASIDLMQPKLPPVSTPWVVQRGSYRGHCSAQDDANVLQVEALAGAPVLKATPTPGWGLHLADANLALGNLVDLVRKQSAAYAKAH
jgi:hypothetical protein